MGAAFTNAVSCGVLPQQLLFPEQIVRLTRYPGKAFSNPAPIRPATGQAVASADRGRRQPLRW